MASKGLIVFALLLLAAPFLVATAEQTQAKKEETQASVQVGYHGGGGGGYHGGGDGDGYPGHAAGGSRCCRHNCYMRTSCRCCTPDEIPEEVRN